MGVGQALALQPGVSRSGVTMTVGRYGSASAATAAARFAFLMSLPITAGALVFKGNDVSSEGGIPDGFAAPFVVGHHRLGHHRAGSRCGARSAGQDALVHAVRDLPRGPRRRVLVLYAVR